MPGALYSLMAKKGFQSCTQLTVISNDADRYTLAPVLTVCLLTEGYSLDAFACTVVAAAS